MTTGHGKIMLKEDYLPVRITAYCSILISNPNFELSVLIVFDKITIKEITNAPSSLLSYKHAGILKNMREVLQKNEPQENASRTSQVFLKNHKYLKI